MHRFGDENFITKIYVIMKNNEVKNGVEPGPMPVGRWTINQSVCIGCCECVDACRRGLLFFVKEERVIIIKNEHICNQCGDCVDACGYYAIVLT